MNSDDITMCVCVIKKNHRGGELRVGPPPLWERPRPCKTAISYLFSTVIVGGSHFHIIYIVVLPGLMLRPCCASVRKVLIQYLSKRYSS